MQGTNDLESLDKAHHPDHRRVDLQHIQEVLPGQVFRTFYFLFQVNEGKNCGNNNNNNFAGDLYSHHQFFHFVEDRGEPVSVADRVVDLPPKTALLPNCAD